MKQKKKRMSLIVKLLIYVAIFAVGGYFFYKYMPQDFKEMVTPADTTTTSPASPAVSPGQ